MRTWEELEEGRGGNDVNTTHMYEILLPNLNKKKRKVEGGRHDSLSRNTYCASIEPEFEPLEPM